MIEQNMFDEAFVNNNEKSNNRKRVHIPFCDVDDLAIKNRHDPNFIANITKIMQVPATITLSNDSSGNSPPTANRRPGHRDANNPSFPMDIPEKLTADGILTSRADLAAIYDTSTYEDNNEFRHQNGDTMNDTTATPPSTPTRVNFVDAANADDEKFSSRTPQIAADLYKRMRPRRSSIETDLHAEIRILRDKINNLEHECQVNTRSCRIFYALLCGYILLKSVSWLLNK